jgi:hypothetical protein
VARTTSESRKLIVSLFLILVVTLAGYTFVTGQVFQYEIGGYPKFWSFRLKTWNVVGNETNIPAGKEYVFDFVIKSPPSPLSYFSYRLYPPPNTKWIAETFFVLLLNARTADLHGLEGPTWMQIAVTGGSESGLPGNGISSFPQIIYLHKTGPSSLLLDLGYFLNTDVPYEMHVKNLGVTGGASIDAIFGSIEYFVVLCPYNLGTTPPSCQY